MISSPAHRETPWHVFAIGTGGALPARRGNAARPRARLAVLAAAEVATVAPPTALPSIGSAVGRATVVTLPLVCSASARATVTTTAPPPLLHAPRRPPPPGRGQWRKPRTQRLPLWL